MEDISSSELELFYDNSSSIWFQHLSQWKEYTLNMRENGSEDFSFVISENNKIVAIVPLVKEYIFECQDKNEFSMSGFPSVYPAFLDTLSKNNKNKIEKLCFEEIFKIAKEEDISYMNFYISPLSDAILNKDITINPLSKFAFHDTTISTNILKLDKENDVAKHFVH